MLGVKLFKLFTSEAEAKGSYLASGRQRLLWYLLSHATVGNKDLCLPDGRQQKQLHQQFKCGLLSADFNLESSLALTPNTSLHICFDCLLSFHPEISSSLQFSFHYYLIPLFCALFTLRKHLFAFFKNRQTKQQTTQIKKVLFLKCSWPQNLT